MEAPKHKRLATYARIRKESGSRAVEEMKEAVRNEYKRKTEWRARRSNGQVS
jgi:hypothetical protein